MRDDYAIAADLCEEHGLVEPTRMLRQIAERTCEAFMVRPYEEYLMKCEVTEPLIEATTRTRHLFHTREAAERYATSLKAAFLREFLHEPWELRSLFTVTEPEFCRLVGAILKIDYRLPTDPSTPLVPAWASDEQLDQVAELIQGSFFEVVRVPIDPGEEGS